MNQLIDACLKLTEPSLCVVVVWFGVYNMVVIVTSVC